MAYSKQTWSDGTTPLSAARMNYMETGIEVATAPQDFPLAVLRQSATQPMAASGWNQIFLDTEDIDTHNGHTGTTGLVSARYTIPAGQSGIYRISACVNYNVAANQWVLARIIKNLTVMPNSWGSGGGQGANGGGAAFTEVIWALVAGDYVDLQGYCDQPTNTRPPGVDGGGCWMHVERIR